MAGVKISDLPSITTSLAAAPLLTDIFPEVQPATGGTTYKTTFQQLYNLFSTTSGSVNAGLINQVAYYAASGNAVSGLATANNGTLITSGAGVPSISSTLPTAVQGNITQLGAQSQALNMNSHLINNVLNPVSAQDAMTLNYAGSHYLALSGGTMTGNISLGSGFRVTNALDPSSSQDYATKNYVDQTSLNGTSVYAASAATLGTVTQSGAGVGATLTNAGTQATFALDGVNPPVGSNVLIKNTATGMTAANEGIYTVTNAGSASTNWVLTRASSYDTPTEINNTGLIVVQNGSTLTGTAWYNAATIVTVDTTAFSYSQFGNTGVTSITAGTGLTGGTITTSGTIGLSTPVSIANGGTNSTTGAFLKVVQQVFTSSGTYTPSAGMLYCLIEMVAGGGGGGGGAGAAATSSGAGGGGGGGEYSRSWKTAAQIGASQTVTVGAGGAGGTAGTNNGTDGTDSSVGTLVTAVFGSAGGGSVARTGAEFGGNGGIGGTGGTGDFRIAGGVGEIGFVIAGSAGVAIAGKGGGTFFGLGGGPGTSAVGAAGSLYGAGGDGAYAGGANAAGKNGANGVVVITEYCNQ